MEFSGVPSWLVMAAGVFVLAGLVKGVVGLGLPTVAVGLLSLRMPPAEAAALLIIPSLITNLWQMLPLKTLPALFKRMWPMQLGICAGTAVGAYLFGAPAGAWANVALGVALIVYAGWALLGAQWRVAASNEKWLSPLIGSVTGCVTAGTGVFVIPAVPYLQALGLNRDQLVQALGLSFSVSTLALAAGLAWRGTLGGGEIGASLLALVPALLGMWLGQALRQRISAVLFKRVFFIGMALLGGHLLISG